MRKQRWIAVGAAAAAGALAVGFWTRGEPHRYVTVPVARADIARAIVTTGAVNPVVTVQVGSYVSGVIQSLSCDFNTQVVAGQVCARIDPRPYQQVVDEARANLATAQAQRKKDQASLAYAKVNYERDRGLLEQGAVSQDTIDSERSTYEQAAAQVRLDEAAIDQRRAALEAAQVNLGYTEIISPVNGIVVSRNIDVGQTVAASFQTPTLFLIAQDLTQMQVDTNVSESDVGGARVGQKATFTVEAYPHKTFEGKVVQVRQAPITVQNVVTYNVVIGVDNRDLLLFPGMTANARILIEERKGVPSVPLQALRFSPNGVAAGDSSDGEPKGERVFVLRDGRPQAVPVTTGIDDGTRVEIAKGELALGDPVILDRALHGAGSGGEPKASPFRF